MYFQLSHTDPVPELIPHKLPPNTNNFYNIIKDYIGTSIYSFARNNLKYSVFFIGGMTTFVSTYFFNVNPINSSLFAVYYIY